MQRKFHTAKIYNEQHLNSIVFPVFGTCKSTLLNDSDDRHSFHRLAFTLRRTSVTLIMLLVTAYNCALLSTDVKAHGSWRLLT